MSEKSPARKSKRASKTKIQGDFTDQESFTQEYKKFCKIGKLPIKGLDYSMLLSLYVEIQDFGGWWKVM